jgi:co-chaperonin GroES (HSP10)
MLQPHGNRLLVKRIEAPKPESDLIVVPDTIEQRESMYALVLAVGSKVTEAIAVADTVILTAYCGSPADVDFDGEQIDAIIVMSDDVLAIIDEN